LVKVLFDTSVLVSAFVVNHPKHGICASWLERAKSREIEGFVATHTLAETYAVSTRIPLSSRISANLAQRLITENLEMFEVVSLDVHDYRAVIANMANLNLIGGSIYDALIAQAALNAGVDILLTLNPKHFNRLGENFARIVQVPSDE